MVSHRITFPNSLNSGMDYLPLGPRSVSLSPPPIFQRNSQPPSFRSPFTSLCIGRQKVTRHAIQIPTPHDINWITEPQKKEKDRKYLTYYLHA
ncbi:unnamed protein product [Tuber melanosporum]|uniref:(Perigord truffle) hypothetical protein n=1 Tax=Tuber melanosporum (strain Mel28) TaxID=656061 RepID=D5G8J3_TUBMM|nr:uncharacterized protein GSTUM_00002899001 [Tuber melanosporum]CAZ80840.1 unnamed protein product [Tuber melanosporum]